MDGLVARMPARLLTEWELYWQREPFGPVQEDLRAGHLCSLVYNANRSSQGRALHPGDFFHSLKREDRMTAEQLKFSIMTWVASVGGAVGGKDSHG